MNTPAQPPARPPQGPPARPSGLPIPAPAPGAALPAPANNANAPGAMIVPPRDLYHGAGTEPFPKDIQDVLRRTLDPDITEITPDGRVYVPAVHYRNVLNDAFGSGGWATIDVGQPTMINNSMSQPFILVCRGRFVSKTRGEQDYQPNNPTMTEATAAEGMHSNAVMRLCKDIGVYLEVFDPRWRRWWKKEYAERIPVFNQKQHKNAWIWKRQDEELEYPYVHADEAQRGRGGPPPSRPTPAPAPPRTAPPPGRPAAQSAPSASPTPARPATPAAPSRPAPAPPRTASPPGRPAAPAPSSAPPRTAPPPGRPAAPPKAAPAARRGRPPAAGAPAPSSAPASATPPRRDPNAVLNQNVMMALKRAAGGQGDDGARDLLEKLTGKRRIHDLDQQTKQALLTPLNRISNGEAAVSKAPDGVWIVSDAATSAILWPLGYTMPPESQDFPSEPAPAAAPAAVPPAPSAADDAPPPPETMEPPPEEVQEEPFPEEEPMEGAPGQSEEFF